MDSQLEALPTKLLLGSLIILEMKAISCFLIVYFFSNTFILYIEIKTSTQTKSYVQTYPFKSIDGISSLDATFFSEEPENIKSPNLIKQLKKLQQ
jgi:hypothetical protein